MAPSERFPWHRCKAGESFFVPSLDPHRTMVEGLGEGYRVLGRKTFLRAKAGAYKGKLGVVFTLPRPLPR